MMTQFRDTQFGHFVRFLSRNKYLRYSDEADALLCKRGTATAEQSREPEKLEQPEDLRTGDLDSREPASSQAVEHGKDAFLVDWYGPDDPENPRNWSSSWKLLVTLQICIFNFAVYIGSSIYVPGEADIMRGFDVSEIVATLGLSFYTVGYGLGPMLWSPLSEMPTVGRGGIYFWTLLIFVLLQLPTGFAVNMPMFLVFRVLTGFFGSPCLATGGGTIIDMYNPAQGAYAIPIWGSFGILGPVVGPIIGGYVVPAKGWRWTIWVVTWMCAAVLIMMTFLMPETSEANILYRRAKRLRRATRDDRLRSQSEIDGAHYTTRDHLVLLGRAFTLTFTEAIVFFVDVYTLLLYGILFTWFESFPLVFGNIYEFDLGQQGLVFLGIFVGGIITLPLFLLWVRYGIVPNIHSPTFKPETILVPTFFGAVSLPICLFFYGWTARESIHWVVPVIGSGLFTVSIITLFFPIINYLGVAYPAYAASIFAGNALARASGGAVFPLFVGTFSSVTHDEIVTNYKVTQARQLFSKLGVGPGNSLLGGIAVPCGDTYHLLQGKSKHQTKDKSI